MIEQYKKHIEQLAKSLNCDLHIDPKFRTAGMMYVEWEPKPYIEVPPITNQIDYLINLHELGHVANNHGCGRPPYQYKRFYFDNGVLKSECQAWEWALERHIGEIEPKSRFFMWDVCLGSYYMDYLACNGKPTRLHNGERYHITFIYDEPDEYFFSVVKQIQGSEANFKIILFKNR